VGENEGRRKKVKAMMPNRSKMPTSPSTVDGGGKGSKAAPGLLPTPMKLFDRRLRGENRRAKFQRKKGEVASY